MTDWIFLDNHSFTKPSSDIFKQFQKEHFNQWLADENVKIRKAILEKLGASQEDRLFSTFGKKEMNFQVHFSHYIDFIRETGRMHIAMPKTEELSIIESIQKLEMFDVLGKKVPVNENGQVLPGVLEDFIRPRISMFSFSWANHLTGVIQPVSELIDICKKHEVEIHLDVSSAFGKLYLPFTGLDVDYLTLDTALFHAPFSMSVCALKKEKVGSMLHTEKIFRGYLSALNTMLEESIEKMDHYAIEVARIRDLFEEKMAALGAKVFFQEAERLPNVAVIAFENVHAELLLLHLKKMGIFATCENGHLAHILQCCGFSGDIAYCALSFALSSHTTEEEILRVENLMKEILVKLRKLGEKI